MTGDPEADRRRDAETAAYHEVAGRALTRLYRVELGPVAGESAMLAIEHCLDDGLAAELLAMPFDWGTPVLMAFAVGHR